MSSASRPGRAKTWSISTWSLALDWKILRLTIPRVLSGGVQTDGNPALDHVAVTQDVQPFDVPDSRKRSLQT
jgi:hypothetical protein